MYGSENRRASSTRNDLLKGKTILCCVIYAQSPRIKISIIILFR